MAHFRHTVTVRPVDRAWFEECAGMLLDAVESTRSHGGGIVLPGGEPVPGVRLLRGRHLRPGARYEVDSRPVSGDCEDAANPGAPGTLLLVREWRRGSAIAVEQLFEDTGMTGRLTVRLRSPDRPRVLAASVAVRSRDGAALRRGSGRMRADLAAWWSAAARPGSLPAARPAVVARAKHLLGRARLTVTPRATDEGVWQVDVTLTVRGRLLMRPVAALALFFCQVPLRRGFRSAVDRAAAGWNGALGQGPLPSGDELRARILADLSH